MSRSAAGAGQRPRGSEAQPGLCPTPVKSTTGLPCPAARCHPAPVWMRDLAAASRRQEKELEDGEGVGAGPGLCGVTRECAGRSVWVGMRQRISHWGHLQLGGPCGG